MVADKEVQENMTCTEDRRKWEVKKAVNMDGFIHKHKKQWRKNGEQIELYVYICARRGSATPMSEAQ